MADLSIGGDTFEIEVEGDAVKPPVLLAHALGADLSLWDAQMQTLLRSFRVIRYNSRGHGGSTTEGRPYSIARLGRDALAILDALEIETVRFVGVSMGGAVGQWLLVNAPHRIERAVLANTAARFGTPEGWNERISAVLSNGMTVVVEATMDRWFSPTFADSQPETIANLRTTMKNGSPEGYAACCAALRDLDMREAIRGIDAPVLVLSGRDDHSIGTEATRYLVEAIPGAKHVVLEARHMSNVEADEAFSKAIGGFLTRKISTPKISTSAKAKPSKTIGRGTPARPATIVSRRVGMRRSAAARFPLGAMAKAPAKASEKPGKTKQDATAIPPKRAGVAKQETAKGKSGRVGTAPPKAIAAKAIATKTEPGKAARLKPETRLASAIPFKAPTTKKTTQVAPAPVAKRPSAKALKAMAASRSPNQRASAKPGSKKLAAAMPVGAAHGMKSTRLPPKKDTAPAVDAKTTATRSKPIIAKIGVAKIGVAKIGVAKSSPTKSAPTKAVATPKAASQTVPSVKDGTKISAKQKTKPAMKDKAKPRRRAS